MEYVLYYVKKLYKMSGAILLLNLLGSVMIGLLEGVSILLLVPLLTISGIFDTTNKIPQLEEISNFFMVLPTSISLLIVLSLYFFIIVVQNLLQRNLTIRQVSIRETFCRNLRLDIYSSLLMSNWSFFLKKRKSDLLNLLTTELARVIGGVNLSIQLLSSFVFTLIQIGIALWLSPVLTLFVITCGLLLSLFSKKFIKESKELGNKSSIHAQEYLGGITDQLNGIKDIKSNTLEESHLIWLESLTRRMSKEQMDYVSMITKSQLYYKVASGFFISIFIFLSVQLFQARFEQLLLIILIFSRLWPRFTGIQSNLQNIALAIPAFKFIFTLQGECKEALEFASSIKTNDTGTSLKLKDGLECQNLSFKYHKEEPVYSLENINFFIPANKMTAIVGKSGAGKSTLVDILLGLNKPDSGEVLIDGVKINDETLLSLRHSIGYVPQDPFLFNGSLRDNLLLVKKDATENELWEAIRFASAAEFARNLPKGLDTQIGDRGIKLSGGERQRIVLARAILRKPSILILDEATSSLDSDNESKIQEAIEQLHGKMTIVVIAHRLSTIRNADQVIVLEKGRVIQQGSYQNLIMEKESVFNNLLSKQLEQVKQVELIV
ncbi:ABC transporter ATP-binding protein [Cytobacillus suaedae]|nr:ABC transporter ATP-binding protein [Cytobacillus suaedae]